MPSSADLQKQLDPITARRQELETRQSQLAGERTALANDLSRLVADGAAPAAVAKVTAQLRTLDEELAPLAGAVLHLQQREEALTAELRQRHRAEELEAAQRDYAAAVDAARQAVAERNARVRDFVSQVLPAASERVRETQRAGRIAAQRLSNAQTGGPSGMAGHDGGSVSWSVEAVGDATVARTINAIDPALLLTF